MRYVYLILLFAVGLVLSSWSADIAHTVSDDGEEIYLTYCKSCHGKKGNLGIGGAAKLTKSKMTLDDRISVIKDGKGKMAPFGAILSKKEIKSVAKFTLTFTNE